MKKQFTITLTSELIKYVKIQAVKEDTKLSALIEKLMREWLNTKGVLNIDELIKSDELNISPDVWKKMAFGKKLRWWREKKNMTQTELAKCIGVTPSAICGYERKKHPTPALVTLRLTRALGITAKELFWGVKE